MANLPSACWMPIYGDPETVVGSLGPSGYTSSMDSKAKPMELKDARAEYQSRWEAVETVKAHELAAMTEEQALQIIQSLGAVEGWREREDWSGLVEQQAIFLKGRQA